MLPTLLWLLVHFFSMNRKLRLNRNQIAKRYIGLTRCMKQYNSKWCILWIMSFMKRIFRHSFKVSFLYSFPGLHVCISFPAVDLHFMNALFGCTWNIYNFKMIGQLRKPLILRWIISPLGFKWETTTAEEGPAGIPDCKNTVPGASTTCLWEITQL